MQTQFSTVDDLWREVDVELGYNLERGIRKWLEEQGYVNPVMTADFELPAFDILLEAARDARNMVNSVIEEREVESNWDADMAVASARLVSGFPDSLAVEEEGEQRELLGKLIAKRIAMSEEVSDFRKEISQGEFLENQDASDWIYQNTPSGISSIKIYEALGFYYDGNERQYVIKTADMYYHDLFSAAVNELSPEDRLARVGGRDTTFGKLVLLALKISEEAGWAYPETVWFLLTGKRPALPSIRTLPVKIFSSSGPRILMEVAMEAAPEEVRTAYKLHRAKVYPRKRSKPLDDKTSAFVRFVLEQPDVDPDKPEDWQRLVAQWNYWVEGWNMSWRIESDERRRISSTYKRAIDAIESFAGGFDHEKQDRLNRIAETQAALAAEYERIYGNPFEGYFNAPREDRYEIDPRGYHRRARND